MVNKNTKKILLISTSAEKNPLININRELIPATADGVHYPLGLAYLYSVLEKTGHEIQLLFLTKHDEEDCYNKIKDALEKFSPEIVGFQMLTFNRVSAYRMIEYIHEKYPHIHQIIGGIHVAAMYQQIIEKYPYVVAVLAEGEAVLPELISELAKLNPNLNSVDGIAFSENGTVTETKQRKLIENLDDIPFPKHELFFKGKRKLGSIITTRGCPFNCSFCCLNSVSRNRVRMRTVNNIIKEIEWMIDKFPQMDTIWIQDDTFFVDNQRVIDFCDEIIKRDIKINFACNGRMKPISEEMVKKLERANFKRIFLGLESGDNRILKKCHKGITQEDAINAYKLFAKTKINIYSHLIVGLSGENIDTIMETANFMKKLQKIKYVPNYYPYLLIVFPGTEIYEIAKAAGSIDDDYWLSDKPAPFFTTENSYEQLLYFQEILLYNVSLIRALFTRAGFKAQFSIIPCHLKYIFNNRKDAKFFFIGAAKFILPAEIYNYFKKVYYSFKN